MLEGVGLVVGVLLLASAVFAPGIMVLYLVGIGIFVVISLMREDRRKDKQKCITKKEIPLLLLFVTAVGVMAFCGWLLLHWLAMGGGEVLP